MLWSLAERLRRRSGSGRLGASFTVVALMALLPGILALLTLVSPAFAADDSSAVNERIPVRKDEVESHWQVDCHELWRQLATSTDTGEYCGLSAGQRSDLRLCSYIYQPPGEQIAEPCPDYQRARRLVEAQYSTGGCSTLKALVKNQAVCTGSERENTAR